MTAEDRFYCIPYTASIARSRCAVMHREGEAGASATPGTDAHRHREKCRGCVVGADHLRGLVALTWADGTPVDLAARVDSRPAPTPGPARKDTTMAKTLTHEGITDTLVGWGSRLGVSAQAIRMRLKKHGGDVSKALAPKGDPVAPKPASSKPARKPADRAERAELRARHIALDARDHADAKVRASTPAITAAQAVRAHLTALDPIDLLRRLGWDVEELGLAPGGRLFVVRGASAE